MAHFGDFLAIGLRSALAPLLPSVIAAPLVDIDIEIKWHCIQLTRSRQHIQSWLQTASSARSSRVLLEQNVVSNYGLFSLTNAFR